MAVAVIVGLLLGHTQVDTAVRCLRVELKDALRIAERVDIAKRFSQPGVTKPLQKLQKGFAFIREIY